MKGCPELRLQNVLLSQAMVFGFCPKILISTGDLHLFCALGKIRVTCFGKQEESEACSTAVTNPWDTFSINQALTHLFTASNASQRNEQKQLLLNSWSETSDVVHPSHPQIGSGS